MEKYKKINSVQKAIVACGLTAKTALPDVSHMPEERADYVLAHAELMCVVEAINLNEDGTKWLPNFSRNEAHYEPWHRVDTKNGTIPSGVGFSTSSYDDWRSSSNVGARQIFRDSDRCYFAMKTFSYLYVRTKLILSLAELKKLRPKHAPKKSTAKKSSKTTTKTISKKRKK